MTGLIWIVQVIHYPLFKFVGENTFSNYHKAHIEKTTFVIAIPMILEIITAFYLIIHSDLYRHNIIFLIAFVFLILVWIVTFFISVPKHNVLANGFNDSTISALTKTNWLRTVAWTLRAVLLFSLLS